MADPWRSEEERAEYYEKQKEERKMTCKDCVYRAMCYKLEHYGNYEEKPCEIMFRNKADYAEAKHGEWIQLDECANEGIYCSVCHKKVYKIEYANQALKSKFCPNCGARMDGDK